MGKGRPRIPDKIHELRGSYRADRHGDPSRKLRANEVEPAEPAGLSDDEKAVWAYLAMQMRSLKIWSATFAIPVELLTRCLVRYRQLHDDVAKHGAVLTTPRLRKDGSVVVARVPTKTPGQYQDVPVYDRRTNPAQIEFTKLSREIRGICAQLGLDPVALSRITTLEDDADEFDGDADYPSVVRYPDGQESSDEEFEDERHAGGAAGFTDDIDDPLGPE